MTLSLKEFEDHLACPVCGSKLKAQSDRFRCTNDVCAKVYPVQNGIPVMLIGGGTPEEEESGFYEKILGGTMEDNPDQNFRDYDTAIRTKLLKRYIDKCVCEDGLLLDVCCSKAPFYEFLKKWGFGGRVFGADMLMHQLCVAHDRGVNVVQANALHLPYPNAHFSCVIFTDALVHLMKREDQQGVINEIARIIKPGGYLMMTATNLGFVALRAVLQDINALKSEYCTFFSRQEIEELISGKFQIERVDGFGFYHFIPWFLRRIPGFMKFFDMLMNNPLTHRFGAVSFFMMRRL